MAGAAGADHLVASRFLLAAGIAGNGFGDAFGVLINRLHTPEAATRQHCRLQSTGWDSVGCRSWDNDRLLGRRSTPHAFLQICAACRFLLACGGRTALSNDFIVRAKPARQSQSRCERESRRSRFCVPRKRSSAFTPPAAVSVSLQ